MSRFSTEFPIPNSITKEKFLELFKKWLITNKNSKFTSSSFYDRDFFEQNKTDSWKLSNEKLSYVSIDSEDDSEIAIKYEKSESNINYISEISFTVDKENNCKWVGIHIMNSTKTANISLPTINKPKLIEIILDDISVKDSLLDVQSKAHYFTDDEIGVAKELIDGNGGNHLPIIYISIPNNGEHILNANSLASDLSGIAHVVVEPNRKFSRDLSNLTNGKNTFGGYIGVYWPKGEGRNIIFKDSSKNNVESMVKIVTKAVSNRRQLEICSWNYIIQLYTQQNIKKITEMTDLFHIASDESESLKKQSDELGEILKLKEEQLYKAEQEIKRLKKELHDSNQSTNGSIKNQNSIELNCNEEDIYPDEIRDIILKILDRDKINCDEKSLRKLHILNSILSLNQPKNHGESIKKDLKQILRGYSKMNSKIKQDLKRLGFRLEEGTHYNLYFGDRRYLFPLAKSSSDKRACDNWISDFSKKMGIN